MPSSNSNDEIEVGIRIPINTLLTSDPDALRTRFGEEVYRQALLKVAPPEEPRSLKLADGA